MVARNGLTHLVPNAVSPASVVQLGVWRNPSNLYASHVMLHGDDGNIYRADTSGEAYHLEASGFGTTRGKFINVQDIIIYANGTRPPMVYDGSQAWSMSLESPTTEPGLAATGTGLTGSYSYVYTYVYPLRNTAETSASPPSSITASDDGVQVTWPSPSDPGAERVRIYRRGPGSAVYLYLTEVPVSPNSYTDNGSVLPQPLAAPAGYEEALNFEHMAFYNGFYFGSIGNTLHWSSALNPYMWPGFNVTELPFEGNDRVTALVSYQDSLLIFGNRNILLVQGQGPDQFSVIRLDTDLGTMSVDSVLEMDGQVVFLSDSGLRVFPGLQVIAPQVQGELTEMSVPEKEAAVLIHNPRENSMWLTIAGRTYVVFLPSQAVSIYDFNPVAAISGGICGTCDPILTSPDGGQIYRNSGLNDVNEPIKVLWESKYFQLQDPELTKFLRRLGMYATRGDGTSVSVSLVDRGVEYLVFPSMSADIEGGIWDESEWDGDALWAQEGIAYFIGSLPMQRLIGQVIHLKANGNTTAGFEIVPPITLLYRQSNRFLGR